MRLCAITLLVLFSFAPLTHADLITVLPDGTGDLPSLRAAITVAVDGDIIELGDGTFSGPDNRDLNLSGKAITIRSASGDPAICIIDCEGDQANQHYIFSLHAGEDQTTILSSITLTGGHHDTRGSALRIEEASARIENCIFTRNQNSAVYASSSQAIFVECLFQDNGAVRGAAVYVYGNSLLEFISCDFIANQSDRGGAIFGQSASIYCEDCLFEQNIGIVGGAVEFIYNCNGTFESCRFLSNSAHSAGVVDLHGMCVCSFINCTFAGNEAQMTATVAQSKTSEAYYQGCTFWGNQSVAGATIHCGEHITNFDNCIIAFNGSGPAISCENEDITVHCTDIFGNAGGNWTVCVDDQLGVDGNIESDPLFCDPENGDFTLSDSSPCLAENNDCGLMGAWGVGDCDLVATVEASWGQLKSLY
jgi:hypothetical protein